jgi:quercetin 2,3-dioxygenase
MTLRASAARGHADFGWLDSRHSFSFGSYHDPAHMGFADLRVINQDVVAPGQGFGWHSHQDMEILSYVLRGGLAHQDSLGTAGVIRPGDIQRMSAGTGIRHAEMNASAAEPVEFLQIWILPERRGLEPSYEQVSLPLTPGLLRIASRDGGAGEVRVAQDMALYRGRLESGEQSVFELGPKRAAWVQMIAGDVAVNGLALRAGDGAAIQAESVVTLEARAETELLLFDLKA